MNTRGGTRGGDTFVTVVIDLTPVRAGTGPARLLLDMVEGRSEQAVQRWPAERDPSWRKAVEVVAMDGVHRLQDRRRRGVGRRGRR